MKYKMVPELTQTEKRTLRELKKAATEIAKLEEERDKLIDRAGKAKLSQRIVADHAGLSTTAVNRRLSRSKSGSKSTGKDG